MNAVSEHDEVPVKCRKKNDDHDPNVDRTRPALAELQAIPGTSYDDPILIFNPPLLTFTAGNFRIITEEEYLTLYRALFRGRNIGPDGTICVMGRSVRAYALHVEVMKRNGFSIVTLYSLWAEVAGVLGWSVDPEDGRNGYSPAFIASQELYKAYIDSFEACELISTLRPIIITLDKLNEECNSLLPDGEEARKRLLQKVTPASLYQAFHTTSSVRQRLGALFRQSQPSRIVPEHDRNLYNEILSELSRILNDLDPVLHFYLIVSGNHWHAHTLVYIIGRIDTQNSLLKLTPPSYALDYDTMKAMHFCIVNLWDHILPVFKTLFNIMKDNYPSLSPSHPPIPRTPPDVAQQAPTKPNMTGTPLRSTQPSSTPQAVSYSLIMPLARLLTSIHTKSERLDPPKSSPGGLHIPQDALSVAKEGANDGATRTASNATVRKYLSLVQLRKNIILDALADYMND